MELIRQTFSKEFLKKAHIKLFDCRTVEADEGKILSYVKELKQRMTVNELSFSVGVVQRYLILEIGKKDQRFQVFIFFVMEANFFMF